MRSPTSPVLRVGHVTVWRDEPEPPAGRGVARTGVTAIVPADPSSLFRRPLPAGIAVLNGAGELTGALAIREWGVLETPVYLTSTMQVGRVLDGAVAAAVAADASVGVEDVVLPVVGECDDSWLNDARVVQVEASDASRALAAARCGRRRRMRRCRYRHDLARLEGRHRDVESRCDRHRRQRSVCSCSRTSAATSRVRSASTACRSARRSRIPGSTPSSPPGSCICVVAIDLPLASSQLERVARRCGLGLARAGSVAWHGSGEIFIAFATDGRPTRGDLFAGTAPRVPDRALDTLFQATVEATEEAVLNALWAAVDTDGRDGRLARALPHDLTLEVLERHGRLRGA